MSPIRCPYCGLTNYPDDLGFPRCGQCHEDLLRCDHCRHQEGNGCAHPQGYARFTPDFLAAKQCPQFVSRHEVIRSHMLRSLPAPMWVSLLLVLLMCSLIAAAWFVDPLGRYYRGNPLRLEAAVPRQVTAGQPFYVTMRMSNLLDRTSTNIYLEIGEEFLANAEPGMPYPMPSSYRRVRGRLMLEYPPMPAGGQRVIHLPFTPWRRGITPFAARIFAPANQMRHEVKTPIEVIAGFPRAEPSTMGGILK